MREDGDGTTTIAFSLRHQRIAVCCAYQRVTRTVRNAMRDLMMEREEELERERKMNEEIVRLSDELVSANKTLRENANRMERLQRQVDWWSKRCGEENQRAFQAKLQLELMVDQLDTDGEAARYRGVLEMLGNVADQSVSGVDDPDLPKPWQPDPDHQKLADVVMSSVGLCLHDRMSREQIRESLNAVPKS